jgi:hypothetical protein
MLVPTSQGFKKGAFVAFFSRMEHRNLVLIGIYWFPACVINGCAQNVKRDLSMMMIYDDGRRLVFVVGLLFSHESLAFQNLFSNLPGSATPKTPALRDLEDQLLAAIGDLKGDRLGNSDRIASIISRLETSDKSISRPAVAPEIYGRWRLLYTTNTDTSSPIQRKAVDTSVFPIYQDIVVNDNNQLVVSQVVKFSDSAELKVDALASTSSYPLPELTERVTPGTIFGLNILGVSVVGEAAKPDPNRPDARIDFVFDEGNFDFGAFQFPYPVPFRLPLFRDLVKGWIDITFLSERVRISKGNKGTTFVLVKE